MNERKYLQFFRAILEEYILNTEINLGRNKTVDRIVDKLRNIAVYRAEEAKNARHERDSQPLRTKRILCMWHIVYRVILGTFASAGLFHKLKYRKKDKTKTDIMKEILAKWSATIESNLTEKRKIILHSRHIIVPLVVYHIYL